MRRLEFSPEAGADLLEIGAYIAADDLNEAERFVTALEMRCESLREFSERGRLRAELRSGIRSIPHGRYVIFYTPSAGVVRIERILHAARDAGVELRPAS